jgi:uncharacterized membrane protein YeaQ/YmgE (transglycosylase-associated protein family)
MKNKMNKKGQFQVILLAIAGIVIGGAWLIKQLKPAPAPTTITSFFSSIPIIGWIIIGAIILLLLRRRR